MGGCAHGWVCLHLLCSPNFAKKIREVLQFLIRPLFDTFRYHNSELAVTSSRRFPTFEMVSDDMSISTYRDDDDDQMI